jgi:hypothetical protein
VTWNFTAPLSSPVVLTADLQDKPGTEIYSLLVFPYESVYIGLVQTFLALPDAPAVDGPSVRSSYCGGGGGVRLRLDPGRYSRTQHLE